MKCKVCGYVPDSHTRFCPNCQSYFVDADKPDSDSMWKGIIDEHGNVNKKLKNKDQLNKPVQPGRWLAVTCLIVSSLNLFLTLIAVFFSENTMLAAMPFFVIGVIFFFLGKNHKISWIALLELIFSFILFLWRFGS